jgi:mercuric ion transport protein
MTEKAQPVDEDRAPARDTGALLLVTGGVAAAFAAASCCALPLLLGSLGVGSAWLLTMAWLAAPYRLALLIAAIVCLVAGGGLLLWRRWFSGCAPNVACGHPAVTTAVSCALWLGAVLVVLGFLYA